MIALSALLFGGIFMALIYATVYDFWYSRKYKTWILLQQDHTKTRRPAAK
jgi:hypothetical protein